MEAEKKPDDKTTATATPSGDGDNKPAVDALAKPNDDTIDATSGGSLNSVGDKAAGGEGKPAKKPSALKKFLKRFNVYFLFFILLIVIGGIFTTISYLNSRKATPTPAISSQSLNQSELKQLANSNATVGGSGETLTVQGNAVFSGNVLVRSDLDVAGTIQSGGPLDVAQLTVSNSANLANTQISSLQVQNTSVFSGLVTVQNGMDVAGNSSFTGNVSIGNLTVTNLKAAGNAQLQIPNHVGFNGSTAPRISYLSGLGGGNASISGSDTSGTVTVNEGGNPQPTGSSSDYCIVTVTFSQPYSAKPNVIIGPVSTTNTPINIRPYVGSLSNTGFEMCAYVTPPSTLPTDQQFGLSYFITSPSG